MRDEIRQVRALLGAFVAQRADLPPPPPGLSWERVARLVLAHRLAATLGHLFAPGGAPNDVVAVVEDHARALRLRGAWLELELGRCLRALEAAGIRPLLLKGISLGKAVYPSSVQRFALDLDFLVRPDEVDPACRSLESLGYRADTGDRAAYYAAHHVHRILTGANQLGVEMHWGLSRRVAVHHLDPDWFRSGAVEIDLEGVKALVPSPDAQLLHAAAQAVDEGFSDLRRIVDAALLFRSGAGSAPGLAEPARRFGLGPALWALAQTVRDATGDTPPAALVEALRPPASRRASIRALNLADACIALTTRERYGIGQLTRLTCAPDARTTLRRIVRYLAPEAGDLSPSVHPPVGLVAKIRYAAPFAMSLAKMGIYLAWRLATRGFREAR